MIIILNSRSVCNLVQMTEKRNKSIHFSNSFSVSLSQCVSGPASDQMKEKYTAMRDTFLGRIKIVGENVWGLLQPVFESPEMQQAQEYLTAEQRQKLIAAFSFMK